ncbi:MAG: hypothetical protein K6T30_06210 [Alicyclobacillus sp.]|nr:hypothetical protein [Alicyclobacillus sp.]
MNRLSARHSATRQTGSFRSLVELELSRFVWRREEHREGQRKLRGWMYALWVLILAIHWLAHSVRSAESVAVGALDVWYLGLFMLGQSVGPGTVYRGSVDHWLAYPLPRWQLVLAKWLAIVWLGLQWLVGISALSMVVWVWALTVHPDLAGLREGASELFLRAFLMALVVLSMGAAFTLLPLAFLTGWARWLRWLAWVLQ